MNYKKNIVFEYISWQESWSSRLKLNLNVYCSMKIVRFEKPCISAMDLILIFVQIPIYQLTQNRLGLITETFFRQALWCVSLKFGATLNTLSQRPAPICSSLMDSNSKAWLRKSPMGFYGTKIKPWLSDNELFYYISELFNIIGPISARFDTGTILCYA